MFFVPMFYLIATTPFMDELENEEAESAIIAEDDDEAEDGELIFDDEVVAELEDDSLAP